MFASIEKHNFVNESIERCRIHVSRAMAHVQANPLRREEARAENRDRMTPIERYHHSVFRRVSGLLGALRVLDDSVRLMRNFPAQLGRGKGSVSRDRWADYHYGMFTVTLASVPDVCVVLAAQVHDLGLSDRHCTLEIVGGHTRVTGKPTGRALKQLYAAVKDMKARRHGHVHRGELADIVSLDDATDEFLFQVKAMTLLETVRPGTTDRRLLREGWREATRTMLPKLREEAVKLVAPLDGLLTAVQEPYRTVSRSLGYVEEPAHAV